MSKLTDDMRRVVREQRLGFVATVCPDGTPNLSPKGTTDVWDDDHLVFADIRSPQTIENLRHNPAVEVNVVDQVARKGYRFKGTAQVVTAGPRFEAGCRFYRERGTASPIRAIVFVKVGRALPVISPAYDLGQSEEEIRRKWRRYWRSLAGEASDDTHPAMQPETPSAGVSRIAVAHSGGGADADREPAPAPPDLRGRRMTGVGMLEIVQEARGRLAGGALRGRSHTIAGGGLPALGSAGEADDAVQETSEHG